MPDPTPPTPPTPPDENEEEAYGKFAAWLDRYKEEHKEEEHKEEESPRRTDPPAPSFFESLFGR
jgi:hypothetical protein